MPSGGLAGRAGRFALVTGVRTSLLPLVAAGACLLAGGGPAFASDHSSANAATAGINDTKTVRYLGYAFRVPASWPVIYNNRNRAGCVRFDQHAVYLGKVSANQFCPSWLLGTTESLLIEPAPASAGRSAAENAVARQITARAPGIEVSATFAADPATIYQILASAGLPVPASSAGASAGASLAEASSVRAGQQTGLSLGAAAGIGGTGASVTTGEGAAGDVSSPRRPVTTPALPLSVTNYRGLGFDACAAPSSAYMNAWLRKSPYRAIGIYIGGADRACAQANLTAAWVRAQAQRGWHFLPLYAGPQAAFGEIKRPAAQGAAAAADAVSQARLLGFGPRTPIYYDMEAYPPKARAAALGFLSSWTTKLHHLGYSSGAYSSSDSGIADLASQYKSKSYAIPDVIYDALWNGSANTTDRHLSAGQWSGHRRVHQFSGNLTRSYGGAAINIDADYLDVQLTLAGGTPQSSPAISLPDGSVYVFYRSGKSRLYLERYQPKSGWSRPAVTGSVAASVPSAVWTGSEIDVFYTDGQGHLWQDRYRGDGSLIGRTELPMMSRLGSAPAAVAMPGGAVDVFWRGSADRHLWHGQYQPGGGWTGPQNLGGNLSSPPSPVISSPGQTSVFFKGADRQLWQVTRGVSGSWSAPGRLGMGPLGGAPLAVAQPTGEIGVYWQGSADTHLWEGYYQPGHGWRGPVSLGGTLTSGPWPVAAAGTVRVFWRGQRGQLYVDKHRAGVSWGAAGWDGPLALKVPALIAKRPFAAAGPAGGVAWAFWWDTASRLWASSLAHGGWTSPNGLTTPTGAGGPPVTPGPTGSASPPVPVVPATPVA